MSDRLATVATVFAILALATTVALLVRGEVFLAGFTLTLVAFAIFIRERSG